MESTRLHEVWRGGGCALNCWLSSATAFQAEQLAALGFDSIVVDMQHGDVDHRDAVEIFTAVRASGATPMARVSWNDPGAIMRLLDAGAFGIVCPMVSSRAEAEVFVGACRYPPAGYRSFGPVRAPIHAGTDAATYFAGANEAVTTFALIETAQGLENLEEIASTPGLDAIYLGAADLAVAHGGPPAIDYVGAEAAARHETVLQAARRHGLKIALHALGDDDVRFCVDAGADLVTVTTDTVALLREAGRQLTEARTLLS